MAGQLKTAGVATLILRNGAHLKEHRAHGSVSVQVLADAIRVSARTYVSPHARE
jgi:hypothetical protein